ncbi:MAG TPA: TIGR04283 family arsenosugar biosynthesis glycosyltransferase [Vicinamibacterales bacterium]|nr:TIGR04283 family arsenosugar biosynthesis glycosyltransferase [Vicinamibacterales bacterium]
MPPLVSIIIPVRGDAARLSDLLTALGPDVGTHVEVFVSAATPVDERLAEVRERYANVTWVESAPGRGAQLNAGAAPATGRWLWFVHADCRLPEGWLAAFQALETQRDVVGGAFTFALDSSAWQARLLERVVALRARWLDMPYGDQGIFVRRAMFESMGGFASVPLMEDVEFVRRLTRTGRLRHLTLRLTTSARRWEREGWLRRSLANLTTLSLYALGVSPERLARRYYEE